MRLFPTNGSMASRRSTDSFWLTSICNCSAVSVTRAHIESIRAKSLLRIRTILLAETIALRPRTINFAGRPRLCSIVLAACPFTIGVVWGQWEEESVSLTMVGGAPCCCASRYSLAHSQKWPRAFPRESLFLLCEENLLKKRRILCIATDKKIRRVVRENDHLQYHFRQVPATFRPWLLHKQSLLT